MFCALRSYSRERRDCRYDDEDRGDRRRGRDRSRERSRERRRDRSSRERSRDRRDRDRCGTDQEGWYRRAFTLVEVLLVRDGLTMLSVVAGMQG